MKTQAIQIDLDGTLSLFKDKGHRNPYDATRCDLDDINQPVLEVINKFKYAYEIIFLSGREDKFRQPTIKFLRKCGLEFPRDYLLFMRETGDKRKDSIIKEELYKNFVKPKFNVLFVMDDRNQVVDMWRDIGLTCFQVAEGDF